MTAEEQHLNLDSLNELKQVMGDEFSLLVETFTSDSVMRLQSIEEAVQSGDPDLIRRAAHSFKGSSSNMGADALTSLCRQLEDLGRHGQTEGAQQLFEQISSEYATVKEALSSL